MTSDWKTDPRFAGPQKNWTSQAVSDPIQRAIGDELKAIFDELLQQPVPERFTLLLRQLEEREQRQA